jgi:hypothetical protein
MNTLTRGNVTEVKVLLASVALALAVYQLLLIAVGYGKLRPPILGAGPATRTHRAVGDTIAVLLVITAVMWVGYFGFEDDASLHVGRFLPVLGLSVWLLLALTWLTSAGDFLELT